MAKILEEDWTLVTNNWQEFLARYQSRAPVHAGLILLTAAAGLPMQKLAYRLALDFITRNEIDLTNKAVRIDLDDDELVVRLLDWPP